MKNLITRKDKHLLYQDELEDTFLLMRGGEVYRFSQDKVRAVVFRRKRAFWLHKKGLNLDFVGGTDEWAWALGRSRKEFASSD